MKTVKMKILFISSRYGGGIGGHVDRLATNLQKLGYDITLMHAPPPAHKRAKKSKLCNI